MQACIAYCWSSFLLSKQSKKPVCSCYSYWKDSNVRLNPWYHLQHAWGFKPSSVWLISAKAHFYLWLFFFVAVLWKKKTRIVHFLEDRNTLVEPRVKEGRVGERERLWGNFHEDLRDQNSETNQVIAEGVVALLFSLEYIRLTVAQWDSEGRNICWEEYLQRNNNYSSLWGVCIKNENMTRYNWKTTTKNISYYLRMYLKKKK